MTNRQIGVFAITLAALYAFVNAVLHLYGGFTLLAVDFSMMEQQVERPINAMALVVYQAVPLVLFLALSTYLWRGRFRLAEAVFDGETEEPGQASLLRMTLLALKIIGLVLALSIIPLVAGVIGYFYPPLVGSGQTRFQIAAAAHAIPVMVLTVLAFLLLKKTDEVVALLFEREDLLEISDDRTAKLLQISYAVLAVWLVANELPTLIDLLILWFRTEPDWTGSRAAEFLPVNFQDVFRSSLLLVVGVLLFTGRKGLVRLYRVIRPMASTSDEN